MKELSVKRLYREVRYCPTRPKRWLMSNRARIPFKIGPNAYPLYILEKILLALKSTSVSSLAYGVGKDKELIITSSGFKFKYTIKPMRIK